MDNNFPRPFKNSMDFVLAILRDGADIGTIAIKCKNKKCGNTVPLSKETTGLSSREEIIGAYESHGEFEVRCYKCKWTSIYELRGDVEVLPPREETHWVWTPY